MNGARFEEELRDDDIVVGVDGERKKKYAWRPIIIARIANQNDNRVQWVTRSNAESRRASEIPVKPSQTQ